jgi:antirestriction protein ArdC
VLGQGSGQRVPSLDLTVVHIGSNAIALKIQNSQGGGASYRSSTDTIHLPSREQFKKAAGFYATALHGLGHNADSRIMPRRMLGTHQSLGNPTRLLGII